MSCIVDRSNHVTIRIRELVEAAANKRIKGFLLDQLRRMTELLAAAPTVHGDPIRNTNA